MLNATLFPPELTERSQWCLWTTEPDKRGRLTKIPYRTDGRKAASNDPTTWGSFATVSAAFNEPRAFYKGVGFFFGESDPFCGIDLDVCLDSTGNPHNWAGDIISRFQDTYRARSISMSGLHVVCRAKLEGSGRNFYVPNGPIDADGKRAQIGVFDRGRFFALTGLPYRGAPLSIADHQSTVEWLFRRMQRPSAERENGRRKLSDSEIVERARQARNGDKFAWLWEGDWEGMYESQSEADLALCGMLAFWCGPSPSRIDTLFRQSGLVRDKWLQREAYRQRTIQAAIDQATKFYGSTRTRLGFSKDSQNSLPKIVVGPRQLPGVAAEALVALRNSNSPPQLFARGGRVVVVSCDERNRHLITDVSEAAFRGRMARSAQYYRHKHGELVGCAPPMEVVRDILALTPSDWGFPPLDTVIETPFLRPNGTICAEQGYDPSTFLFFAPAPGLHLPAFADIPMIDDVEAMLDLINSAIGDFPFVDAASKANTIASMLTPVVRPAIDGPTPLALYDAPQAGTGKTLLAEVIARIATGRPAETFSAPNDPEEWRKKITTALSSGTGIVVIDNVKYKLDSDALCSAITATTISDRVFRTFEKIVLPVRCTWIANGNNIQLGGDMPRRCYWIRLDAKESKPFCRTGFKHENLRAWVTEHRGELIVALLTLARYWFIQGQPKPKTFRSLGSFESWCNVVGGILEAAGVEGFLANSDLMFEQADTDALQWEGFLLTLYDLFSSSPFRVTDVVDVLRNGNGSDAKRFREAMPDLLAEAADRTGGFFQRRLGRCFSERVGRRFGLSQTFLERAGEDRKTKVRLWKVAKP